MGVNYKKIPKCYLAPQLLLGGIAFGGSGASFNPIIGGGGIAFGGTGGIPFPPVAGFAGGLAFGGIGGATIPPIAGFAGGLAFGGQVSSPFPPPSIPTPDYWWKFSNGSGATVTESIAGNNGTISGTPTWSMDSSTNLFSLHCFKSDGFTIPTYISSDGAYSVSIRAKIVTTSCGLMTNGNGDDLTCFSTNNPVWSVPNSNAQISSNFIGGWHQFGFTKDAGATLNGQQYFDGNPLGSTHVAVGAVLSGTGFMGAMSGSGGCEMFFQDIRMWSSQLSASDMANVYANTTI